MAEAPFPPYRRAICRKVPSSFAAGAVRMEEPESAIDMARLEQQHRPSGQRGTYRQASPARPARALTQSATSKC